MSRVIDPMGGGGQVTNFVKVENDPPSLGVQVSIVDGCLKDLSCGVALVSRLCWPTGGTCCKAALKFRKK